MTFNIKELQERAKLMKAEKAQLEIAQRAREALDLLSMIEKRTKQVCEQVQETLLKDPTTSYGFEVYHSYDRDVAKSLKDWAQAIGLKTQWTKAKYSDDTPELDVLMISVL